MKRWRAILLKFAVLVFLGAIVNVAVAWGAVFWPSSSRGYDNAREGVSRNGDHYRFWMVQVNGRSRDAVVASSWHSSAESSFDLATVAHPADAAALLPAWAESCARPDRTCAERVLVQRFLSARGWPMAAVYSCVESEYDARTKASNFQFIAGLPLISPQQGMRQSWIKKVLPIRPIWPGFAINTVFYAAVLWGLFAAPFALRRRRRIKRGLCPKCAYPVRGSASDVCTECGAAIKRRLVAPQLGKKSPPA